jgi:chromosome segregation ATPase
VNVPADADAMIVQTDTGAATGTRESIQINTGLTENNQMVTTEEDNHSEPKEEPIVTKQIKNPATNPTENNKPANTDTPKTVEELEAEVAELQAQLETAQADLTTAQAELTTAQEKVTDLTAKVEESEGLTQQVQELTVKNEELTNANESLVKDLHNATVEFLVDVKVAFNQESDREQAKEKFASRTLESLRDAINDALQTKPAVRESVRVEPPAGTTVNTESTPANKSLEEQYEEVLVKLFSGNKR